MVCQFSCLWVKTKLRKQKVKINKRHKINLDRLLEVHSKHLLELILVTFNKTIKQFY